MQGRRRLFVTSLPAPVYPSDVSACACATALIGQVGDASVGMEISEDEAGG